MSKETVIAELRELAADDTNRLTEKAVDLAERLINQEKSATMEEHPAYRVPETKKTPLLEYSVLALSLVILAEKVLQWL